MDDDKDVCLMCGTNVKEYSQANNFNSNQPNTFNNFANNFNGATNNTNAFNANSFNNANQGFNQNYNNQGFGNQGFNNNFSNGMNNYPNNFNNNQGFNNNYGNMSNYNGNQGNKAFGSGLDSFGNNNQMANFGSKKANKSNDYRNVSYNENIKSEDKDIFDFFSENKKIIKILGFLLLALIIAFAAYKYYEYRTKPATMEPVFQNLYYEVDESFSSVSEGNNNSVIYNKSGSKGSDCSISIASGASTEGDHVKDYFNALKKNLEPQLDNNVNVINELDIYIPQDSSMVLNSHTWYYLNIFYKKDKDSEPTTLRYKYLTALYNGFYYDIALINNSNDAHCNASLDNFAKSLAFVES